MHNININHTPSPIRQALANLCTNTPCSRTIQAWYLDAMIYSSLWLRVQNALDKLNKQQKHGIGR